MTSHAKTLQSELKVEHVTYLEFKLLQSKMLSD